MIEGRPKRTPEKMEFMPEDYFRHHTPLEIFGNDHPCEVDLGCGDGKFLIEMAQHYPERNFIGVERLLGRARKVARKIERCGLSNARVLRLETQYVVEWLLAPESISRLHLLCPDPWPKAKHHKRRVFQVPFLKLVRQLLVPGGEFCFKTDHDEYFEWALEELDKYDGLTRLPWDDDTFFYPKTDFQLQWEAEGKSLDQLRLQKPL